MPGIGEGQGGMSSLVSFLFGSDEKKDGASKNSNLNDPHSVKRLLDEVASEIILGKGYQEDVHVGNVKILLGLLACGTALVAQFYPKKFPDNQPVLVACIVVYLVINAVMQYVAIFWEKNHILFTHPEAGSLTRTGLAVSSTMERFSDLYTLRIGSADPKSIAAQEAVELRKSITLWFAADGALAEDVFTADVESLLAKFEDDSNTSKKGR